MAFFPYEILGKKKTIGKFDEVVILKALKATTSSKQITYG
jgi:hypothetical protein